MDPMDLIRDKFSQDCTIETVLHLLMAHFDLSKEEAQAEIDEHFKVDMIDEDRKKAERDGNGIKTRDKSQLISLARAF